MREDTGVEESTNEATEISANQLTQQVVPSGTETPVATSPLVPKLRNIAPDKCINCGHEKFQAFSHKLQDGRKVKKFPGWKCTKCKHVHFRRFVDNEIRMFLFEQARRQKG